MTRTRWRRWELTLAGLAIAVGVAVIERLGSALAAMHRAGDVSAGYGSVASPSALWSASSVRESIRAWRDWNADRVAAGLAGHFIGPYSAVSWYAAANLLLVVAPVTVLVWRAATATAGRIRRRLPEQDDGTGRVEALLRVAELARWVVLGYLGLTAAVAVMTPVAVRLGDPLTLVRIIGLFALLADVALACAVIPLAFAELATLATVGRTERQWTARRIRAWAGYLVALRGQVVCALLIALLIVALRGDLGLQVDDVAMRWIENWPSGVLAALGAVFAGWLMLLCGETCWYRHWRARGPVEPMSRFVLSLLGAAGLALTAAGFVLLDGYGHAFGGVLVWPGAALLLFAALSLPQKIHEVRLPPVPHGAPGGEPGGTVPGGAGGEAGPAGAGGDRTGAAGPDDAGARAGRARGPAARRTAPPPGLLWVTAAVPLAALGLIATRAATTLFVSQQPRAWWLAGVAVLALAGAATMIISRVPSLPDRVRAHTALWAAAVATAAAGLATALWPVTVGPAVGAIALLFLLVATLSLMLTGASLLGEAWTPSGALALLGLRRMPVLAFMLVWAVVTSVVVHTDRYHDVRLAGPLPAMTRPVTLKAALDDWVAQRAVPAGGGRVPVPMVFISAAGGGIRAAYWTAMVLDCLFGTRPVQPECAGDRLDRSAVFAESGISGGSVGLAFDRVLSGTGRDYAGVLGQDFVSPDVAALGFRDVPLEFLRLETPGIDRAAVLEQAWERAAGSPSPLRRGLFADSRDASGALRFPLLMLDGATVDDACRLNGSVLAASPGLAGGPRPPAGTDNCLSLTSFEPGRAHAPGAPDPSALAASKDLYDYLCPPGGSQRHDIALSTAALLSARFPYVSPTGGLSSCGNPQRRTFDIDGGLIDSSGLSPLSEVWSHLAGDVQAINDDPDAPICVQPRLLMLDNGYQPAAPGTAPTQPQELLAPIQGQSRVTAVRSAQAEQAAALAFDHAFGSSTCRGVADPSPVASRVANIVPTSRPGTQAPLGWSLSQFARDDLEEQLDSPANRCQIELVRSWFGQAPTADSGFCLTGFAVRPAGAAPSGPPALSLAHGPLGGDVGVAGVRLTVDGCVPGPRTTCSVTSDAAGRFNLLLTPGEARSLTVSWGGATLQGVPVPDHPGFVDTSLNLMLTGRPRS